MQNREREDKIATIYFSNPKAGVILMKQNNIPKNRFKRILRRVGKQMVYEMIDKSHGYAVLADVLDAHGIDHNNRHWKKIVASLDKLYSYDRE